MVESVLNDITAGGLETTPDDIERPPALKMADEIKSTMASALKLGEDIPVVGDFVKKFGGKLQWVVSKFLDDATASDGRENDAKVAEQQVRTHVALKMSQQSRLRAAAAAWGTAIELYANATKEMETQKNMGHVTANAFSDVADDSNRPEVAILSQLWSETDAATQQCDLVLALAQREQGADHDAKEERDVVKMGQPGGRSLSYFDAVPTYANSTRKFINPASVGFTFDAVERHVLIFADEIVGPGGVHDTVESAVADLMQTKARLVEFRDKLQRVMGLGQDTRTK